MKHMILSFVLHDFYVSGSEFTKIWGDLALTLEDFLFPTSKPPANQTSEEQLKDEGFDVKVVVFIRDSILSYASQTPKEFVLQVVSILNRGSIHSATTNSPIGKYFLQFHHPCHVTKYSVRLKNK